MIGASETSIDLNLAPEVVKLDGYSIFPNKEVEVKFRARMPVFFTMKISTQITLTDGSYGFLGTLRPDKASADGIDDPVVLAFVRGDIAISPNSVAPADR